MKKYWFNIKTFYRLTNIFVSSMIVSLLIAMVDIFNIPTEIYNHGYTFIFVLLPLILFFKYFKLENINMLVYKHINVIDKKIIEFSFASVILLFYVITFDFALYKLILLIISSTILVVFTLIRIHSNSSMMVADASNIMDLKYVMNNKVELTNNKLILLEEKEVEYDLLNRKFVINQLYDAIIKCEPESNFTIGLNGKWGSGKTTIVKNVLHIIENNGLSDDYVIINFDPWAYDDEKVILKSFLNEVLDKVKYTTNNNIRESLIRDVLGMVFDSKIPGLGATFNGIMKNFKDEPEISSIVNNYLNSNNKKMLIIIDNLDRVDIEQAMFLIKFIEAIAGFKRTINVMLYDENILNNALNKKFNNGLKYLDKIVQLVIDIPEIDIYTINRIKSNVANNLLVNGTPFINFINNEQYKFDNLRELKRFFNALILSVCNNVGYLNNEDDANLKYLKSVCPKLYYIIWENKEYFITYDRRYEPSIYTLDYEKLNKSTKSFYEELFSKNEYKNHLTIMAKMFPSVKNYLAGHDPFSEHIDKQLYDESIIGLRVSNARYFDLYFTREENDFIRLNNDVLYAIWCINEKENFSEDFISIISKYDYDELKVFSEIFNINLFKINDEKVLDLVLCLFNCNDKFKNRVLFFELDSYGRLCIIIADLLSRIGIAEFNKFKSVICHEYKNLHLISEISHWIDNNKKKNINYSFEYDELLNEMCDKVLRNNINIYSDKNYKRLNIWALYRYDKLRTKEYIKKHINSKTIYYILADIITTSTSSHQYGYSMAADNVKALLDDIDIDALLEKHGNILSDKQKIIKQVYELYKTKTGAFESELYFDDFVEL